MKSLYCKIIILQFIFISCATQKQALESIPKEDESTPIYYCSDNSKFIFNGFVMFESSAFGVTSGVQKEGSNISGSKVNTNNSFLNYPLGKMDYSYMLSPSLSKSGKYLAKANDDFAIIKIRVNRNVDVDVVSLAETTKTKLFTIEIPRREYTREKYQIPWSKLNDSFFGLITDTLFRFFPNGEAKPLLTMENIYDFNISPTEKYAVIFASDSLFLYNLQTNSKINIFEIGRVLGMNRKYVRSISWLPDETKLSFSEEWDMFIYDLGKDSVKKYDLPEKIFAIEWINSNSVLCVTGDCPDEMSQMQFEKHFKILNYSLTKNEYEIIHKRSNHEPFTIKPKLSPSGKLVLFSERKLRGEYEVKLMTLDGKNENILADGFLPFWGSFDKK